jgi:PPOX class probable F420-dependent enzyme
MGEGPGDGNLMAALLTNAERHYIDRHRIAHLATADAAGAPHVIPICYALVGDHVYFLIDEKPKRTRTGLKRLRNIAANPQVALVIDDYDEDWSRLAFLLVQGTAEPVADRREFAAVLAALQGRYPQYRSMPLAFATHPMIRITPVRSHGWSAGENARSRF